MGYSAQSHFQQYYSYIMAVSFIGGVSTLRKPQILKEDAFFFLQYELSISSFLGNDKKGLLPVMLLTYLQFIKIKLSLRILTSI